MGRGEARAPFDLAHGPLIRVRLLRLGPAVHVLLATLPHVVSDGWSFGVLVRDFTTLYAAAAAGQPSPLPPLPVQYADVALWQRAWLQGAALEAQRAYWRTQLAGLPPLALPTDRPRASGAGARAAIVPVTCDAASTAALRALSRREGVTLFMTLLAAWQVVLGRLAGQDDVAVGTDVANRTHAETEGLIGFFVNQLVLRTSLRGDPPVRALLAQVRETCLAAYAHQDLPFEQLVEDLAPARSLTQAPLFQVKLLVDQASTKSLTIPDLHVTPWTTPVEITKLDLILRLTDTGETLTGGIEYATALWTRDTVTRLGARLQQVLVAMVADPAQPIHALPIVTPAERVQLLETWNATTAEVAIDRVTATIAAHAAATPDAVAVIAEGVGARSGQRVGGPGAVGVASHVSYAELWTRATQLAAALRTWGVGPEVRVAVYLERGVDLLVALIGVLESGGAYVPLDPHDPAERLAWLLDDAQAPIVLTQEGLRDRLPAHWAQVVALDTAWVAIAATAADVARDGGASRAPLTGAPETLAYVIYTSGLTGRPKGVLVTHAGLRNYLAWARTAYPVVDGALVHTSVSVDLTVTGLWAPLLAGAPVRLTAPGVGVEAVREAPHGVVKVTPTHLRLLASLLTDGEARTWPTTFVIGGEALPPATVAWWQTHAPLTHLINEYGPTETVVGCCVADVTRRPSSSATVPIGAPIANTRVYVLDAAGDLVPPGVTGELYLGGAGVARGYWRQPALTADRFVPDAWSGAAGTRLYRTGDRVRARADGTLEFLGRRDGQVKIRGHRVELGELEAVLGEHGGLAQSAVVVRESAGGDATLVAYVVPAHPDARRARGVRRGGTGVAADACPRRAAARGGGGARRVAAHRDGESRSRRAAGPHAHDECRGRRGRRRLHGAGGDCARASGAKCWASTRRAPAPTSSTSAATRWWLRKWWHGCARCSASKSRCARSSKRRPVRALAGVLEQTRAASDHSMAPPLRSVRRDQAIPLSFAQQRLWFIDQLEPGQTTYNIAHAVRLTGALDFNALRRSVTEIVRRHEVLRDDLPGREWRAGATYR